MQDVARAAIDFGQFAHPDRPDPYYFFIVSKDKRFISFILAQAGVTEELAQLLVCAKPQRNKPVARPPVTNNQWQSDLLQVKPLGSGGLACPEPRSPVHD